MIPFERGREPIRISKESAVRVLRQHATVKLVKKSGLVYLKIHPKDEDAAPHAERAVKQFAAVLSFGGEPVTVRDRITGNVQVWAGHAAVDRLDPQKPKKIIPRWSMTLPEMDPTLEQLLLEKLESR